MIISNPHAFDKVLSRSLAALSFLAGLFYAAWTVCGVLNGSVPLMPGPLILRFGFAVCLFILGFAFPHYYPYNLFGFLPLTISLVSLWGGVLLGSTHADARTGRIVLYCVTGLLVFFSILKEGFYKDWPHIKNLPLNFCNFVILFLVCKLFYRQNAVLDNCIICFGFIAGVINDTMGGFMDNTYAPGSHGRGLFYHVMLEGMVTHNTFFFYTAWCIVSGNIVVSVPAALLNIPWVVVLFIIFSFLNQVWQTDYFFTGIYGITPPFLVALYHKFPGCFQVRIAGRQFDVHPLYYLFIIVAESAILLVTALLLRFIQSLISPV
jgi:hypothetical protein